MNYKEEAKKLIHDFYKLESLKMDDNGRMSYPLAKQCALLHLKKKINTLKEFGQYPQLTIVEVDHYQHVLNEVKNS